MEAPGLRSFGNVAERQTWGWAVNGLRVRADPNSKAQGTEVER